MRVWAAVCVTAFAVVCATGASGGTTISTSIQATSGLTFGVSLAIDRPTAPPVANPLVSAQPDVVVGENAGFVDLTLSLSAPGLNPVSVAYITNNGTATGGSACDKDFVPDSNTLIFLPGEMTKVVHVQILDCFTLTPESLETFTLDLFNNAFIARASVQVAIVDNDTVVTTPSVIVRDVVVDEQAGKALVTVLLGGLEGQASAGTVTVDYVSSNGTATAGADYTAVGDTLNFAPGQVVKTVEVPILDDGLPEPAEDFSLKLSNANGATIADGTARVVIGPSDAPATAQPFVSAQPDVVVGERDGLVELTLSLSAPGLSPVKVAYITNNATATGGSACDKDFVPDSNTVTFLPGETTTVVHVQILNCPVVEGFETFTLDLFNNAKIARASTLVTIVDSTITLNSIAVTPSSPTIAKGTNKQFLATGTYSNNVSLDLTSSVVWTSASPAVATVDAGLFNSGGLAHAVSQGTSTITATLGALSNNATLTVGPAVLATIAVTPANPTIVNGADQQFTATGTLTDGTTTDLTGAATWSSATPNVATVAAGGLAHATGVGTSTISASSAGLIDSTVLSVTKAPQTITFGALANKTYGDADFAVSATASSGLTVSFTASGDCTVSAGTVHITAAGTCTITASQLGNVNFNAATSVPQTFLIAKADQTITVNTHAPASAAASTSFLVAATATGGSVSYSSSGACTNSGASFTTTSSGGTCTVSYDQSGNTNYNSAPQVTETVTVTAAPAPTSKVNQTIAFGALASKTYGDADFAVSASASSGLAVSFTATGSCTVSGSTVHITGAGSCAVSASQAGNATYNAAPTVSQTFSVGKAGQAITFGPLGDKTYGDVDFTVSATASSTLAVSFAAGGSCSLTAATVHLTGVGSCTVTASQAGNANYNAAADVARTFSIAPKSVLNPAQTCKVPKVVGKRLAPAKAAIKKRHCRTGKVGRAYSRKVKKGIVVSQSRRAGKVVAANSKINLVVSKGRAPSRVPASAAAQLVTFVDGIEKVLIQSAASRRTLAAALTAGFSCSTSPRATGQRVAGVAASRQTILGRLGSVRAPTQQSSRVLALLKTALQESIRADLYYRDGFFKVVVPQGGCPLPPNANFKLAAKSDARATAVKKQFVAAFNPLATSLHRAVWSAGKI
jgi:hypothetical protein